MDKKPRVMVLDAEGNAVSEKNWTFFKILLGFSIENIISASEMLRELGSLNDEMELYSGVLESLAKRIGGVLHSVGALIAPESEIKEYLELVENKYKKGRREKRGEK